MSCPPFIPGTAANPEPGCICSCALPIRLANRTLTTSPAQTATINRSRLFIIVFSVKLPADVRLDKSGPGGLSGARHGYLCVANA